MSSARQAVHRADNLIGFGKRPDFTPFHQDVLPSGINVNTCANLKKPVSGISCISPRDLTFNHDVSKTYSTTKHITDRGQSPVQNGGQSQSAGVAIAIGKRNTDREKSRPQVTGTDQGQMG
jgi:hypothetical protein